MAVSHSLTLQGSKDDQWVSQLAGRLEFFALSDLAASVVVFGQKMETYVKNMKETRITRATRKWSRGSTQGASVHEKFQGSDESSLLRIIHSTESEA